MASAKELKKQRQRIEEIQREQASKPKSTVKAKPVQMTTDKANQPIANILVGGKVIGQMKTVSVPTTFGYVRPTGAPGFKSMGRGRRKNRMGLHNKIK